MEGSIIYAIRNKLGISQEELARQLEVSFATVNRWETGKCKPSKMAQKNIKDFCLKNGINLTTGSDDNENR